MAIRVHSVFLFFLFFIIFSILPFLCRAYAFHSLLIRMRIGWLILRECSGASRHLLPAACVQNLFLFFFNFVWFSLSFFLFCFFYSCDARTPCVFGTVWEPRVDYISHGIQKHIMALMHAATFSFSSFHYVVPSYSFSLYSRKALLLLLLLLLFPLYATTHNLSTHMRAPIPRHYAQSCVRSVWAPLSLPLLFVCVDNYICESRRKRILYTRCRTHVHFRTQYIWWMDGWRTRGTREELTNDFEHAAQEDIVIRNAVEKICIISAAVRLACRFTLHFSSCANVLLTGSGLLCGSHNRIDGW